MYYVNPNLVNLHRIVYQNNRKDYLRLDLNENPGGLPQDFIDEVLEGITPQYVSQSVSYTHLTLPTKLEV